MAFEGKREVADWIQRREFTPFNQAGHILNCTINLLQRLAASVSLNIFWATAKRLELRYPHS